MNYLLDLIFTALSDAFSGLLTALFEALFGLRG